MREDLEQQEQLDAIRGFWNDNKRWILPLITLLFVGAASFNLWRWYADRQVNQASQTLVALQTALSEQSIEKARVAYKALANDHASTTQAAMGGLQMAKVLVATGELAEARGVLEAVTQKSADEFAWVARIRLAGVMLDENNAKGALEVVSARPPKELQPLVNDRKGDALIALGQKEEARAAWKAAADAFPPQSPTRELVLRKLQTIDSFAGAQ